MPEANLFEEANRQLTICNACRYCEGLCPVFPALEARRSFDSGDIRYLANLCHDCRACYEACMFTEPHEFAINIPKLTSTVRLESFEHWSWPRFLARSFVETPKGILLGVGAALAVLLSAILLVPRSHLVGLHRGPGSFYQIVSYVAMIVPAVTLVFLGSAIWLRGGVRFWSESDSLLSKPATGLGPLFRALRDSATTKYLGGGGPGCTYPSAAPSQLRRIFHTLVVWGFLSDLISTTLAFIDQDFFGIQPPYALMSGPVIFGTAGGIALVIGTGGLVVIKMRSGRWLAADNANSLDYAFLVFLGLAACTGLVLLICRSTIAMGSILILHLAAVAALFITAPYGKFVHFVYRGLALIRYQIEIQGAPHAGRRE
jgi:citrate/tricarballylate utilization protein